MPMSLELVEADPEGGFHHPYFLAVPETTHDRAAILVEPTNMPGPTDDVAAHLAEARRRAAGGFGRRVAAELGVPFLHPVFPRPATAPVDWTHYTHQLDAETLSIREGPLARIDRQLRRMVADARARLANDSVAVRERFLLNGFSASGTFANRFAALHPEAVLAVTAGGFNGMAILPEVEAEVPVEALSPRRLEYPVGVADLEELTGEPFDIEAFRRVTQFLYLGADDDNDPLLYPDAWTAPEIRATAVLVYGEDIHEERLPRCRESYEAAGVDAVFRRYHGVGHDPGPAFDDVVTVHRNRLAGAPFEAIADAVGPTD
ncbi:MAG: hypothetical protein ACLFMX_06755 [Halobacteriales archaeon]